MAWAAPAAWTVGEIVTAGKMNTQVRDNLAYLKGGTGQIALDAPLLVSGLISGVMGVSGGANLKCRSGNGLSFDWTGTQLVFYIDNSSAKTI